MAPATRYSRPAALKAFSTRSARLKRSCKRSSKKVLTKSDTAILIGLSHSGSLLERFHHPRLKLLRRSSGGAGQAFGRHDQWDAHRLAADHAGVWHGQVVRDP